MNKKNKPTTALEKFDAIQAIGTVVEVPYDVWRIFVDSQRPISIVGTEISLGEDYVSLDKVRDAIEWYVNQFGGTVKWTK